MTDTSASSPERVGFSALAVCLLAPVVAQGLWRPFEHVFGAAGSAQSITAGALTVGALAVSAWWFGGRAPWLPLVVSVLAAVLLSLSLSLGLAGLGALIGSAAASALVLWQLPPRLPLTLDGLARRHRLLAAVYGLAALLSVVSMARLSVFIGDPTAVEYQALPGEKFTETHSCLSAYVRASELARQGAQNLYEDHWWHGSRGLPPLPVGVENPWRPFELDNFSYPPPFLLVAELLAPLSGDFLAQRALWFGFNGVLAALGLWVVARWVEGPGSHRVLLLAPLFLGSVPVLVTLQIGNFHIAAVVLAVLAMVAFEGRRAAQGGLLLALTTLSKISPGLLGVGLLVRRRAREVACTVGFAVVVLGLSVLIFGVEPLQSFVASALPRLSSGRAFPFMDTPDGIATNLAPFGIPFKLKLLGLQLNDPWLIGQWISRAYTLGLLALAVASARRQGGRNDQAIRWMSLLTLAALQSPFSPAYGALGLLWATTLLAVEVRQVWQGFALFALWPAILLVPPDLAAEPKAVLSMIQTTLILGVAGWLLTRAPRLQSPSTRRTS